MSKHEKEGLPGVPTFHNIAGHFGVILQWSFINKERFISCYSLEFLVLLKRKSWSVLVFPALIRGTMGQKEVLRSSPPHRVFLRYFALGGVRDYKVE